MKLLKTFLKDRSGATALEFAMIATPLFAGMLAIVEFSYKSILQTELDNSIYAAAGDLAINNVPIDNASEFMRDHFCTNIGTTFLKCTDIQIGIDVLVNRPYTYRNTSFIGRWDMGCVGDPIMIEMNYPLENFVHPITVADVTERGGKKYYRSRAVIRREPMLSGSGIC